MELQDNRYLKISLDDAIIKADDEQGVEKLRLCCKIEGKEVLIRFPAYGDWDFYVSELAKLMRLLAQSVQDIELDIDLIPEKYLPQWCYVLSEALKYKECLVLVEKIFLNYLRPHIEGVEDAPKWLRKHMDISHIFYFFVSILHIEDWFKKKSRDILEKTFPSLIQRSSKDTLSKNVVFHSQKSEPDQSYKFD